MTCRDCGCMTDRGAERCPRCRGVGERQLIRDRAKLRATGRYMMNGVRYHIDCDRYDCPIAVSNDGSGVCIEVKVTTTLRRA